MFFFTSPAMSANLFDSPQNLEYIIARIPVIQNRKCLFSQEKFMPNNVVLKSSGLFSFDTNSGITFTTLKPVYSVNSYSTNEYGQINKVIDAILHKNYKPIENQFDFYFLENFFWQLGLVPKHNTNVSKYIKSIEVEGRDSIIKIIVTQTNSVKTVIRFYE